MDAYDLNSFATAKRHRRVDSAFIPQLTIGTQPAGLGSVLAPVTPVGTIVNTNTVPFVEGGYPHPLAPPGVGTQNQNYLNTTAAKPPWVSVPLCKIGVRPPKAQPLGLQNPGIASLNFPAPKNILRLTTY